MMRKNKSSLAKTQDKEEKDNKTNEPKLKGLPYFMVAICVILGAISVELGFMNVYLKRIALGSNTYGILTSTNNNPYSVFSEAPSTAFYNSDSTTTQDITELSTATTDSSSAATQTEVTTSKPQPGAITYVLNKNSKKIHYSDCTYASNMKEENKLVVKLTYSELEQQYISQGYVFCSKCGG